MAGEADEAHLPLRFARSSASITPPFAKWRSGSFAVHDLVHLPEVEVVGLEPAQRLLELRIAVFASRPCVQTFVIRKTCLPPAVASALPMRVSLSPSWYSQALSMNVMPASTAACTMRIASRSRADLAEVIAAEAERGHGLAGAAEGSERNGLGAVEECA